MRSALILWVVSAAALRVIPGPSPSHLSSATPAKVALPLLMRGGEATTVDPDLPVAATQEIPPLAQHPARRVSLLVEPTPFTHVSGYSNRFKEMLRFLKDGGDDIEVITPDDSSDRPSEFLDIPITYVPGFRLFLYKQVQLTVDLGLQGFNRLKKFNPDLIHVAAPGFFVAPAIAYSRVLGKPLVISYHTHLPVYAERYVPIPGLKQLSVAFAEWILPTILNWGDLTLATSPQLKEQLESLGCSNVDVWRKGIDTEVFNPKYNVSNAETRAALTDGNPSASTPTPPPAPAPAPLAPTLTLTPTLPLSSASALAVTRQPQRATAALRGPYRRREEHQAHQRRASQHPRGTS